MLLHYCFLLYIIFPIQAAIDDPWGFKYVCAPDSVYEYIKAAFFDDQCATIWWFDGNDYEKIAYTCYQSMPASIGQCQVVHMNGLSDFQKYSKLLNIPTNDSFYLGLKRDSCESPWLWHNFDNTTSPLSATTDLKTPAKNTQCNKLNFAYDNGTFKAVNDKVFRKNTTGFICECWPTPEINSTTTVVSPTLEVHTQSSVTVRLSTTAVMTTTSSAIIKNNYLILMLLFVWTFVKTLTTVEICL